MNNVTTVGIDLAKNVFSLHGVDAQGQVVLRTMRESKRKKLAAKGWKTGSAREFLGLSPEEEAYIELRLKLADGLKMRRHSRGVTQTQLDG